MTNSGPNATTFSLGRPGMDAGGGADAPPPPASTSQLGPISS